MAEDNIRLTLRTQKISLPVPQLSFFYKVLLMVENDEPDRKYGYHWEKVKSKCGRDVAIINNNRKNMIDIPEQIKVNSIYFRECESVGWKFLNSLRNAFAHNYIVYDEETAVLTIKLLNKRQTSIKLYCKLKFDNLTQIVETLQQTRTKK